MSDEMLDEMVALYLKLEEDSSKKIEADGPIGRSVKLTFLVDHLRKTRKSVANEDEGCKVRTQICEPYGRGASEGKSTIEEGKSTIESDVNREDSEERNLATLFSRNERFFVTPARYSTSKHNRFLAALQELRRLKGEPSRPLPNEPIS